jgi:hypothetical protein
MDTGHHHPRDPEEDDVEARDQYVTGVVPLQFRRLFRPAQRGERPQRRGKPGVEHVGIAGQFDRACRRCASACGLRLILGRLDEVFTVRAVPGRQSDGPTRAGATRTRAGCCASSGVIGLFPLLGHEVASCRSSTASSAGFASVAASQNHWSVSQGSMATPERSPCGTVCGWSSISTEQAQRLDIGDDPSRAPCSGRGRDRPPARSRSSAPRASRTLIIWQIVPLARPSKSLKSCAGVIFTAPVPFSGSDVVVRDDWDDAVGQR